DPTTLAVTGDSLAQGSTANRDFMKSQATTTDLTTNIAYHLSEASDDLGGTKWTYQSLGRSGITMANTEAYFDKTSVDCTANTCVLDLLPEIAYVVAGHNDVATGVAQSTTLTALTGMLDACEVQRAAGALTRCMVLGVPPWTAGTDTQMRLIDDLNMAMSELTAGYNNAMFIDSTIYTGKARATGPLGNLWDIQTSPDYNDDNTHLNSAGYAQVAQASWDLYNSIAWSTATDNTPVLIVSKDSQQVGVGGYPANGNALTVAGNIGATGNLHLGGSVRFGTSELITETVEISAATLNGAAAVTVISAKGTDTLIEFVSAILPFKDATDYDTCDATSEFVFQYETSGDDVSDEFESVGFIDGGADAIRIVSALSQSDVDITANTNKAIQILNTGTQCANGTGVIHSKITYRVYALGL
ncbi:SGNH/GDSL hydrolase family protein, partial [Candidatus Pacearchaeota archaeon]|nr:SGNH/GDSL hydrolase family protein [Candidatus Pacearchaeota archaeon]